MKTAAFLCACLMLSQPAAAATITQIFDLSASNFTSSSFMPNYPYTSFTGRFSITFDNSSDVNATKSGFVVTGFNGSSDYDLSYSYDKSTDSFTVATLPLDYACSVNEKYFCFFVPNASTTLQGDGVTTDIMRYSAPSTFGSAYYNARRTITQVAAVPEPNVWTMMTVGFGVIGFALRRRRRISLLGA